MTNRYKYRRIIKNDLEQYSEIFRNRSVNFMHQYATATFTYLNADQYSNLTIVDHIWTMGDKYYKLASDYYADPRLWWVIARFNLKPTEAHLKVGDIIQIPTPLDRVLNYLRG